MSIDYTSTAIVVLLVGALLFLLGRAARKKPPVTAEGALLLRFGSGYMVLGYVSIGMGCLCAFAFAINRHKSLQMFLIWAGIMLLLLLPGLYLVFFAIRTRVECDEQKVRLYAMNGKLSEVAWHEVGEVKYDKKSMWLSLIGPNSRAKVHVQMVGFNSFIELMKKKLDSRLYKDAFK
jgi:hypothetical protein